MVDKYFLPPNQMNFISSEFGLPAFCSFPPKGSRPGDPFAQYKYFLQLILHTYENFEPQQELSYVSMPSNWPGITEVDNFFVGVDNQMGCQCRKYWWGGQTFSFKAAREDYEISTFGEAPDNLLR